MARNLMLAAALALPFAAQAGTIDTLPSTTVGGFTSSVPRDAVGGSFFADDVNLASFSLEIQVGNGPVRAIVMDVVGGLPSSVLWESPDQTVPSALALTTFTPNIPLTPGLEYFIGLDAGAVTSVALGANAGIGFRISDVIPGSVFTRYNGDSFWSPISSFDIASRIEMTPAPVPLPASVPLLGAGLLTLCALRRRRGA